MRFRHLLAAALLLAGSGISLAQNIPFSTIGRGSTGPMGPPENKVIRTQAELDASGLAQYTDPAALIAPIDWSQEMVVAVLQGTQTSGGHGVEITGMELEILTPMPPFDPSHPPPLGIPYLNVSYRAWSPGPGDIVTLAITSPFHMVRVSRFSRTVFSQLPDPAPAAFERVALSHDTGPIGGTGDSLLIEVQKDGSAVALRSSPTAHFAPQHGQASAAQLAALTQAVERARAASLPAQIPPGVVFVVQPRGFDLQAHSNRPQLNGSTAGVLDHYGTYDARLRPLVDAMRAIGDSLLNGAQGTLFEGRVQTASSGAVRLNDGSNTYRLRPADKARELAQFSGRTVRVRGTLQPGPQGPQGDVQLEVSEIVSPEHETLRGVVEIQAGRPIVHTLPSPIMIVPTFRVRTFGAAADVLRRGVGRVVTCDAWVFKNAAGEPVEARIDSVEGKMRQNTRLYDGATYVGLARRDEGVHVQRLSGTGSFARVKAPIGTGWCQSSRIEIGSPNVPLASPGLPPAVPTTTGIVNAIPGQ